MKINNKFFLAASALIISFVLSFVIVRVEAASNDSSINLAEDPYSGKFTLTIKDPDGIQEFSLSLVGRYSYGGGLSSCPKSFSSDDVSLIDPSDFTPVMPAYIVDCKNNKTELEIPPPVDGVTKSIKVTKEEEPAPVLTPVPQKEEKKEGPLSAQDIQYPVPDLGNCQNETECRSYCDNADRAKECFAFAKKYHLISEEEAEKATDHFLNIKNGPGGCNSGKSCEAYCSTVEHIDECIVFAEKTGYYEPEELAEAKKFQALIKAGTKFPGGCTERNTCEIYCGDPNHMEECLNFAEKSGFMPPEEIAEAKKFMTLMQKGESPGGCTSKEQCENYCFEDNHIDECIAFAEKAGVMSPEDAQMARKAGGKGPGNCRSKEQCDAYCQDHSEECFNFAKEHGLINEDELAQMREGMTRFREELDKMPPEAVQCMKDAAGEENFNKMIAGEPVFDRGIEGKMKSCFGQVTAQFGQQLSQLPPEAAQCIKDAVGEEGLKKLQSGEFGEDLDFESLEGCFQQLKASFGEGSNFSAGGFSGPGGCKNTEECTAYCQEHMEECQGFGPPGEGDGGFSECGITTGAVAVYVCGVNGQGAPPRVETTYFNECHAKQHDAEILHEGGCEGHAPCSDIADPVCGNDGNSWTSACYAEEKGGGVQYKGVCKSQSGGGGFSGPGGCTSQEECMAYCQEHMEECRGFEPPGGGDVGGGGGTQSCAAPPSGLVSWWSADLASGTTVPDISDGNNGTISGGVTTAPMEVGDAFQFDGSSGRISMGNPANLNFGTGPFSLETWLNWSGGGSSVNNIIRKSNYGPNPGSGYWLRIGRDTKVIEFSVGATAGPEGQSIITAPISSDVWNHVVATKDSAGDMKIYIDGQSKGTYLRQASNAESTSESPFALGSWEDQNSEFFSGMIDDAAVYNRALSMSEVQDLFDAGSIGKCATSYGRTNRELPQDYQQQFQQTQPPAGYSGPGGCTNKEECTAYCTQNGQDPACQQFMPSSTPTTSSPQPTSGSGSGEGGFSGPGGCTNQEECMAYCTKNYQDPACQQFAPSPTSSWLPNTSLIGAIFGPLLLLLK